MGPLNPPHAPLPFDYHYSVIWMYAFFYCLFYFIFCLRLQHMEVPRPGIWPVPQQWLELLQRQHQIQLCHKGTHFIFYIPHINEIAWDMSFSICNLTITKLHLLIYFIYPSTLKIHPCCWKWQNAILFLFTYLFFVLLSFQGCTRGTWRFPG